MITVLRVALVVCLAILAFGCESKRALTIRPDGSGEIHEKFVASLDSYEGDGSKDEAHDAAPKGLIIALPRPSQKMIAERATSFGQGVRVVSYKELKTSETLGYEAVFAFSDVTKLDAVKFLESGEEVALGEQTAEPKKGAQKFEFVKGPVSELRITLKSPATQDHTGTKSEAETGKTTSDPALQAAMTEAIKQTDIRIAIRVEGEIEETNSQFRDKNQVIIREMNFKGMAADPKYADIFGKPRETPSMDDLPKEYVKEEDVEVLKIRFR